MTIKNLQRKPAGTFYFRKVIPKHLRTIYGKSEIIKSLGKDESAALREAQRLAKHYEEEFKTIITSGERDRAVELLSSFKLEPTILEHQPAYIGLTDYRADGSPYVGLPRFY